MRSIVSFGALVYFAVILTVGVTNADIKEIPPLFRENPNVRAYIENRADESLDYRLPNATEPIHYDVDLTTNVHTGERAFTGTVQIELKVIETTNNIVVHARQLSDFTANIRRKGAAVTTAEELNVDADTDKEREFLNLTPKTTTLSFEKDSSWILTINYKGQLRTDNGGFYLSTYKDANDNVRYLATTQFESTDARHAFPCYDEPAKRATFTITIHHNAAYNAISNMPIDAAKSGNGVTVFQETPNMPSYLVAFIVSDFEYSEGVLDALPQRVYSRPGSKDDQEWALVSGMLIANRLAAYYGVPFSLPKLYQAAIPDFAAGAMENWGLATYREEYMLYNPSKSTVNTETNVANIIAHEYCHQWFGNLVAVKWWTYLWLKEGFATLFSYRAADDAYPEWGIFQMFHASDYQSALNNDATLSSVPMTHYVQTPREISGRYNYVSYAKAGSVLYMWQNALSDKVFQTGLNKYLTVNSYSAAEEWQLFDALQSAAKDENFAIPEQINNMMSTWTHQSGYPLLTVERNYNDGSFTVKQEAFFNDETIKQDKSWFVPINYATQTNGDFRNTVATHYLLNVPQLVVSDAKVSKDDWLILNKQSTGYYRINYDERNWDLINTGLFRHPNKIHPYNRAQLLSDAYRFSSSNRLSHKILLSMLTYLTKEDQYTPWSTANTILTTFNRYLSGDKDYNDFQYFVSTLVTDIYDKLGVNDIPGEQHFQKYTRSVIINLACLAGIESCLKETNDKLLGLINNNIEIEPNLQSQTYCNGLRDSADKEYDYVYNKLMNSEDQAQRRTIISALGCSQKESQLKKFIESSIDKTNKLREQERYTLLSPTYSRGAVGLSACIDFLDKNWVAYSELNPGFGGSNPLDDDIRGMSQYVVNKDQETKLLALVTKVKESDKVSSTLEVSVQNNIKANFDWLSRNRDPLMTWITALRSGSANINASFLSIVIAFAVLMSRLF